MKPITSPSGTIEGVLLSAHDRVTELSPRTEVQQLRWDIQSIIDPIRGRENLLYTRYENWEAENSARRDAGISVLEYPEEFDGFDVLAKLSERALVVIKNMGRTHGLLAVTCDEIRVIGDVDSMVAQMVNDGTAVDFEKKYKFAGEVTSAMLTLVT